MSTVTTAILQARMGSSRLPGKTLAEIFPGLTVIGAMIERVRRAETLARIVIATTDSPKDDPVAALASHLGVPCFRGSEDDVLDRYYQAARVHAAGGTVVRLTGDCPLHDPAVIDQVVRTFHQAQVDYASNVTPPTFPDGLDVEVFAYAALERAWREATLKSEREHVTLHIRNHPERYRQANVTCPADLSALRWTLDEPADLDFVRAVYGRLYRANPAFGMADILALLQAEPGLAGMNQGIIRNAGLIKSILSDSEVKP